MAGRPRAKLQAAEALRDRAFEDTKAIRALTPESYRGQPTEADDEITTAWKEARRCAAEYFFALSDLCGRLEAKVEAIELAGPGVSWRNRHSRQANDESEQGGDDEAQLDARDDASEGTDAARDVTGPIQPIPPSETEPHPPGAQAQP